MEEESTPLIPSALLEAPRDGGREGTGERGGKEIQGCGERQERNPNEPPCVFARVSGGQE